LIWGFLCLVFEELVGVELLLLLEGEKRIEEAGYSSLALIIGGGASSC